MMGEINIAVIGQRLADLRNHLGERWGEKLSIQDVAAKAEIAEHKVGRLEHGKGSAESFIGLLLFYRNQGYNLDWIIFPEHANVPMMLSSGKELLIVSELVQKLSQRLHQDYQEINTQLKVMGYSPLEDKHFASSGSVIPEAFDFSS